MCEAANEPSAATPIIGQVVDWQSLLQAELRPTHELLVQVQEYLVKGALRDPANEYRDLLEGVQAADTLRGETLKSRVEELARLISENQVELISRLEKIASDSTEPPQAAPTESANEIWQKMILGAELCQDGELAEVRQSLFQDVISGSSSARALAGQLMLAQAVGSDQLTELLKQVGEAYYRWRPRSSVAEDPLEKALAHLLTRRADAMGLKNSIQLVRPGERFDNTRHIASERGVEIVAVYGWVVLRDNGKVYTKAAVAVK